MRQAARHQAGARFRRALSRFLLLQRSAHCDEADQERLAAPFARHPGVTRSRHRHEWTQPQRMHRACSSDSRHGSWVRAVRALSSVRALPGEGRCWGKGAAGPASWWAEDPRVAAGQLCAPTRVQETRVQDNSGALADISARIGSPGANRRGRPGGMTWCCSTSILLVKRAFANFASKIREKICNGGHFLGASDFSGVVG